MAYSIEMELPFDPRTDDYVLGRHSVGNIFVLEMCPGKVIARTAGISMAMDKGTLALLIHGGTENWSPARWKRRFDEVCTDRPGWPATDGGHDPASVHYAAVWKPIPGELAAFPNLKVI